MFLEVDEDFTEHPKSLRLCRILMNPLGWAYVIKLWRWCTKYQKDGDLTLYEKGEIEYALGWTLEEGVLFAALVKAGFVEEVGGRVLVHDWDKHQGKWIRKLEADRERARERRNGRRAEDRSSDEPVSLHDLAESDRQLDLGGDAWARRAAETKARDNHTCQGCGATDKPLEAHHKIPIRKWAGDKGEGNELSNLVSLCRSCHKQADAAYKRDGGILFHGASADAPQNNHGASATAKLSIAKQSKAEQSKETQKGPAARPVDSKPVDPLKAEARRLIAAFCDAWKVRNQTGYMVLGKDAGQLEGLLKSAPGIGDELPGLFGKYLDDRDPFLLKQGYSISYFCSSGAVNKYRANTGPPPAGNVGHYRPEPGKVYPTGVQDL